MPKNYQNIIIVSISTLGSRVMGLVRDIMMFAVFGAGGVSSAFIFAFTLPNLFRRLLGEGALSSALIPVLSTELEQNGKAAAFAFMNKVVTRVGCVLVCLVIVGAGILWGSVWVADTFSLVDTADRFQLGGKLGAVMMPYMFFICLAAIYSAALNILQRFAVAALTGVWLNVGMIAALGLFAFGLGENETQGIYLLTAGVLFGGLLQFGLPFWALRREGWRFKMDFQPSTQMTNLYALFVPGVIGASIFQINLVVSRSLAFHLDDTAVSILYLANRLVEFPLGMFAVAVTTVVFPRLSRLLVTGDKQAMGEVYAEGLRLILGITIPASVGLAFLREPILEFLFGWGAFKKGDITQTMPVLFIFAWALPLYALATYEARAFHALKDTRSPVKVAFLTFLANVLFSLIFMYPFGAAGLALASALSTLLQVILLSRRLREKEKSFTGNGMKRACWQIAVAAVSMSGLAIIGWYGIGLLGLSAKLSATLAVCGLIPACVGVYGWMLWKLGFHELLLLRDLLEKKLKRRLNANG